jgi:hypothetical protein
VLAPPGSLHPPKRLERPTVDVLLSCGQLDFEFKALIDTGAPRNVFPRGCADALAIDLSGTHKTVRQHELLGNRWDAVPVLVHLTLPPFHDLTWEAEVDFLLDDWPMPFGLLGQEGFLDRWVVIFNRYKDYFIVQEVDAFEQRLPVDPWEAFQQDWDGWNRPG